MNLPPTQPTPCDILASKQSALQQAIFAIQATITLNEAGLANDDPGFPRTWDMAGVLGRLTQLQPGPLADRYWALVLEYGQLSGYQSVGGVIAAAQKFNRCPGTGA